MSLTPRQAELLMFIHSSTQASGVSPSYEEMAAALGVKARSGIHRLIEALVWRGYIRHLARHARSIDVLRLPYGAVAPEVLASDNANMRDALLRARDALQVYEPHPANALSAVVGALRGTAGRDHA